VSEPTAEDRVRDAREAAQGYLIGIEGEYVLPEDSFEDGFLAGAITTETRYAALVEAQKAGDVLNRIEYAMRMEGPNLPGSTYLRMAEAVAKNLGLTASAPEGVADEPA
jgi:hypothetical protein